MSLLPGIHWSDYRVCTGKRAPLRHSSCRPLRRSASVRLIVSTRAVHAGIARLLHFWPRSIIAARGYILPVHGAHRMFYGERRPSTTSPPRGRLDLSPFGWGEKFPVDHVRRAVRSGLFGPQRLPGMQESRRQGRGTAQEGFEFPDLNRTVRAIAVSSRRRTRNSPSLP